MVMIFGDAGSSCLGATFKRQTAGHRRRLIFHQATGINNGDIVDADEAKHVAPVTGREVNLAAAVGSAHSVPKQPWQNMGVEWRCA